MGEFERRSSWSRPSFEAALINSRIAALYLWPFCEEEEEEEEDDDDEMEVVILGEDWKEENEGGNDDEQTNDGDVGIHDVVIVGEDGT